MIEMLIVIPVVLAVLSGMVLLFGVHFARQRTYGALPEAGRIIIERGDLPGREFQPTQDANSRIEVVRNRRETSLSADEVRACTKAGYIPVKELRRVAFNTTTTCPGAFSGSIDFQTAYSVTRLARRSE